MANFPVHEHELIGALYDSALGNLPWSETAKGLTQALDGSTLTVFIHKPLTNISDVIAMVDVPDDALSDYNAHFSKHDVWILGALRKRLFDRPFSNPELIDDGSFQKSEFYNDFLRRKVSMYHAAGALMTLGGGRVGIVGIHRPRDHEEFAKSDIDTLGRLLPHLRASLELRQRVQFAEATTTSALGALDRLSAGVILLSATGLLHANSAAEEILRANDGLAPGMGGIRAASKTEDARLQGLIAGARATTHNSAAPRGAGGRVRISRPSGHRAYMVAVMPYGRTSSFAGKATPGAIVFVTDPARRPVPTPDALLVQFAMPPAEAKLVIALVSGIPLPQYAAQAGISYHTARTLLARAMVRTETQSQLELVRLVLASVLGIE